MAVGILEVKLGRPYQMPERRLQALLQRARLGCCRARNAAITHWYVWRQTHPDWEPGGEYEPPARKIRRKPSDKPPAKDPAYAPREFLSRELYHVATGAVPDLNSNVVSACVQEVNARLRSKTPYDHEGVARYVWQAILISEVSLPCWRGGRIPMPRKDARLHYSHDDASITFPLLSKKSGYRTLSPRVRLDAGNLTAGNRQRLKRLASGELRLADSQIVERKGKWFVQLCHEVPTSAVDLPVDRVLTVRPSLPEAKYPFTVEWVAEHGEARSWQLGNGQAVVAEYRRLQARRRALRHRYQDGCGKGHGRQRFYRTIKPLERSVRDLQARFTKLFIADLVKLALREGCGSILYREPTKPLRNISWWAKVDVPFNWADLQARLAWKCETSGLAYQSQRIGIGEWRPKEKAS